MYPVFQNKHVLRIYQIQYCESRFEDCERYKLASAGTMPPPEVLPILLEIVRICRTYPGPVGNVTQAAD